jgi:hypothetical protein
MAMGRRTATAPDEPPNDDRVNALITSAMMPHIDLLKARQHGQHLTDEEEAALIAILATQDGNVSRTSKICGLSTALIWNVKERNAAAFLEARERFKRSFVLRLQDISAQLTERVADAIESQPLSVRDGMVSLGIAIDKAAMLAGEGLTVTHRHTHEASPEMMELLSERIRAIRPCEVMEADFRVVEGE